MSVTSSAEAAPPALHALDVMDAENALLGILLCDPTLTAETARTLSRWDFHGAEWNQSPNAAIFARLTDDALAERRTEPHVLAAQLAEALTEVGGASYIGLLIAHAPPAQSLPELARQVATVAARRRIARVMADPALDAEGLAAVLEAETRRTDALSVRSRSITATPFVFREPRAIPLRQWLYDKHFVRRFLSATFAPGGVGKTMLLIVEALAMATGRPLLGVKSREPLTVWLLNLEDPREEMERRVAAVCLHHGISAEDIGGRLYIDTAREAEVIVARSTRSGVEVNGPCVRQLEREIDRRKVDVLIIDPFVACHEVPENDNSAVGVVAKAWRDLADRTNCGIELVHHTRKASAGQAETTVEDGRGASALLGAVRSARVLNPMNEQQATEWGVDNRRLYLRVDNGKANLAPPGSSAKWRRMVDVDLENGPAGLSDRVGVPVQWEPPGAFDGVTVAHLRDVQQRVAKGDCRKDPQAGAWVGHVVAEVLGWSLEDPASKARVKTLLKSWFASGALRSEARIDPKKREEKLFVTVGEWAGA